MTDQRKYIAAGKGKHNYKALAEYLYIYSPEIRKAVYGLLRRAPECGFMDSPNEKKIEAIINEKENELISISITLFIIFNNFSNF